MYAASDIGSRDSSCKRCKQKQRKQASHQKQTRKQLAINQPHWRPGSDAAQSHRVYHGASGAVSEAEFHNISKEGGTSHAPGDGELNDGAAYDMWSRSPQKQVGSAQPLVGLICTARVGALKPLDGDRPSLWRDPRETDALLVRHLQQEWMMAPMLVDFAPGRNSVDIL